MGIQFDRATQALSHNSRSRDVPPLDRTVVDGIDNGAGLPATCADGAVLWLPQVCVLLACETKLE